MLDRSTLGALVLALAAADPPLAAQQPAVPANSSAAPAAAPFCPGPARSVPADSLFHPRAPIVVTPASVRGLYVNRWAALGKKIWELIDVANATEVNALVIDVKDDRGFTLYPSRVPLARAIGADTNMPMRPARLRAILDTMRSHGIYPIARIVVAKDPLLAEKKGEWAIRRRDDPTKPWLDKHGMPWVDAHQDGPWRYAAELACEAVDLGFSEVQFDYVRFPDEKRIIREATFPLAQGRLRADVIRAQLQTLRARLAPLGVPVTADVFGLTATDTTDMGIGQKWERFVDAVDVVLPMVYPSHFAPGSYRLGSPNAHPYETIDHALKDAKHRSTGIAGAARVVPWLQDFTLGPPHYGAAELRAQIKAAEDNGITSWMLWNPGSRYSVEALRKP
ncbi:MAG: putative glycoside hydrolase [Gemmatimonadaceae bacterium]